MPYPNFHSARIETPIPSNSAVFATKSIAPGVTIILQKNKDDGANAPMKIQAYRFRKGKFTPEEAKSWLSAHTIKYMSFEPAGDGSVNKETRADMITRITKEISRELI